ncbi:hypothetical protein [Sulfurimonas sp.]|uniref:hypothetical protein n=1 Tax=Sulfurimonas sp. TaxID=2022749 RepID=UPI003D13DA09
MSEHKKYVLFSYLSIGSNIITGLILFPLIIKNIGFDALGIFGIIFSAKSIIDIGIGWLSGSMTKNLIHYKYLKYDIFTSSIIINVLYGIFAFCVIYLFGFLVHNEYLQSFFYFGLFSVLSFALVPFYEYLRAMLKQYQVAFFRFLQQFLFMVLALSSFVIFKNNSLDIIFLMLLISTIFTSICVGVYYFYHITLHISFKHISKKLFYKLLYKDGVLYFLQGMSTILLFQLDILLIDLLYGSEQVALYLLVWKIPNTLIMLGWRLSEPYQAIIAKEIQIDKKNISTRYFLFEKKLFILSIFVFFAYVLTGEWFMQLWLGVQNTPNINYMYLFPALAVVFSTMQRFYISANYFTFGLNKVVLAQFFELLLKTIFIVFLFDCFGVLAPIIGWLCAYCFTLFIYRKNAQKVFI